jgi:hypothetical protein
MDISILVVSYLEGGITISDKYFYSLNPQDIEYISKGDCVINGKENGELLAINCEEGNDKIKLAIDTGKITNITLN